MDFSSLLIFAGVYFLAVASPGPSIAALVASPRALRRINRLTGGVMAGAAAAIAMRS